MNASHDHVKACALQVPGHAVSWMQARLTWSRPRPHHAGVITAVDDSGFVFETEQGAARYLNHDPARLLRCIEHVGPEARLVGHGALKLSPRREGGIPIFNVKLDEGEPLGRCMQAEDLPALPSNPTYHDIARYLIDGARSQGGTTIHVT